jgi:hypothetical protein
VTDYGRVPAQTTDGHARLAGGDPTRARGEDDP